MYNMLCIQGQNQSDHSHLPHPTHSDTHTHVDTSFSLMNEDLVIITIITCRSDSCLLSFITQRPVLEPPVPALSFTHTLWGLITDTSAYMYLFSHKSTNAYTRAQAWDLCDAITTVHKPTYLWFFKPNLQKPVCTYACVNKCFPWVDCCHYLIEQRQTAQS